jgi:hypothetical protein
MKKILIFIILSCFTGFKVIYAQSNSHKNDTICFCQIANSMAKDSIAAYLTRNYIYGTKADGATLVKFYPPDKDSGYYKFVISKILFRRNLKKHKPKTYTLIEDIPVLIYGTAQTFNCVNKKYESFYRLVANKFLVDDPDDVKPKKNKDGSISEVQYTFDPEILEIKMKGDSIISRKYLLYQPSL